MLATGTALKLLDLFFFYFFFFFGGGGGGGWYFFNFNGVLPRNETVNLFCFGIFL